MVVEGFLSTLTVLMVEDTELLSYSEYDASFTFVVDGNCVDNILLPLTANKLDLGVIRREEIRLSVDNKPIAVVGEPRSLTLFILGEDEAIAFAEETVKAAEYVSRTGDVG